MWKRHVARVGRHWTDAIGRRPLYAFPSGRSSELFCLARRGVGTQTPLFRVRREAELAGTAALAEAARLPMAEISRVEHASSAAAAVDRAFSAAVARDAEECYKLMWEVRGLPRTSAVRQALKMARPTETKNDSEGDIPTKTLLQAAASAGLHQTVRLLLDEFQVSVFDKDSSGKTALHFAAEGNHAYVAQMLLARGRANADARDAQGRTPLLLAAEQNHVRTARVLMRFGASPAAADRNGRTPFEVAKKLPDDVLGPWLEQFAAKRHRTSSNVGKIQYFKRLGSELPAHVVAPKLILTPVGYCPEEDGKVKQLKRGIRCNKRRSGPTSPSNKPNWYAIRY